MRIKVSVLQWISLHTKNFACTCREIDLIVSKSDNVLAFVEVHYRRQIGFGSSAETESSTKQARIQKLLPTFYNHIEL